jgi:hypothetical protein
MGFDRPGITPPARPHKKKVKRKAVPKRPVVVGDRASDHAPAKPAPRRVVRRQPAARSAPVVVSDRASDHAPRTTTRRVVRSSGRAPVVITDRASDHAPHEVTPAQVNALLALIHSGHGPGVPTGPLAIGTPTKAEQHRADVAKAALAAPKHKSFGQMLEDELTGRGGLAKALGDAAHYVGENADVYSTGTGPNVSGAVLGTPRGAAAITHAPAVRLKDAPFARRGVEDLVNFPAVAIPSLYVPAASAVEAAAGNSSRGKKFLHDLPRTDPIAALVTGHPGRAVQIVNKHPGFAALEVYGAKGVVGRGTGRALRSAPKTSKLHRIGSTARADKVGPTGTGLRTKQAYSRDTITKASQVARERVAAKRAVRIRKEPPPPRASVVTSAYRRMESSGSKTRPANVRVSTHPDGHTAIRAIVTHNGQPVGRITRLYDPSTGRITMESVKVDAAQRSKGVAAALNNLEESTLNSAGVRHLDAMPITTAGHAVARRVGYAPHPSREGVVSKRIGPAPDPELLARATRIDPYRMSDTEVRRRVDERMAVNETLRRHNRAVTVNDATRAITNTRTPTGSVPSRLRIVGANVRSKTKPTAATVLHAQAITKATVTDLRAYRDELAAQHDNLPPSQALANRQLRTQIGKAIARKPDKVALKRAASRYTAVMRPLQAKLADRGILAPEQTVKAPLVPYAIRRMGAVASEHGPVHANGSPVTVAEIRAHMAAHDVKEPTYVTQAPGQRGRKNFFVSSARPPGVMAPTRTGAATKRGTFDAHPDVLIEGAAKAQGLADAADGFAATIKEFAHKPSLGNLKTRREADTLARDLYASTGEHWRPVRVNPFGAGRAQLDHLLADASADHTIIDALDSAIKGQPGPGPWALIPEVAADRLTQHLHSLGSGPKAKALRVVGQGFRRTVLATSPSWMTGNVTEAALRAGVARAGPLSYATGRRVVKRLGEIDPKAQQELTARATGGGHFSMADRTIHTDASQFAGGPVLEPMAKVLGAFWRKPGPKHVAGAWRAWTDVVFRQLNGRVESQFQTAMLGRALRESPLMDRGIVKLGATAVDQAARGLRDTNEQARFAHEVRRMYGRYDAFAPDTRLMIQNYTPFIAWWLNSVKFVYSVLPRDHPAVTTLIASAEQATEEWRKNHGLDLFMGGKDTGQLPGFLQGSIPLAHGAHQRAPFRYTPFGAFGDPLKNIADTILPQFSGILSAFNGEDWKGKKLVKPDGSPADEFDKAKAAAAAFIDATIPIVAQVKRADAKGLDAFNPLAPIAPTKKKLKKTKSGVIDFSTFNSGGGDPSAIDFSTLGGP